MPTKTKETGELPYKPQDRVRLEYLPFLLIDIGISQALKPGFLQSPQAWLAANATKDFIYQFYNNIRKGDLSLETTM